MRVGNIGGISFGTIFGLVLGVLTVIFGLTIAFGAWYTIDQTQRGVLLRNGAYVETVQPGLHFKWPWIDSVNKVDMQTHTKTYGFDPKTGKSSMEAYSADQQPANLRVSVTLHVQPDKAADIYARFGGDYEAAISRLISPHVYERVKVVFGQYTAARAITARGQLNADAVASMLQAVSYDPIFVIDSVQIEDISFSGEYIKSVEARMMAEVEVSRYRQQLEREKVQATIAVTQAQGRADAVVAEAKAAADAIKLRGEADGAAIRSRGMGEGAAILARGTAEASNIKAKADALGQNPNLVTLMQAERWDGKLPVTMVPSGSVPMITLK